uniref:Serpentine receptor class gamma n=1 Tax=Rhabditophanes sp. KR3021 TaxID=114890 RepID=A0AC35UFR6_9BILA
MRHIKMSPKTYTTETAISINLIFHSTVPFLIHFYSHILTHFYSLETIPQFLWTINDVVDGLFSVFFPYTFVLFLPDYRKSFQNLLMVKTTEEDTSYFALSESRTTTGVKYGSNNTISGERNSKDILLH